MISQIASFLGMQAGKRARVQTLSPQDAHTAASKGGLVLVDVRTPEEWAATGLPSPGTGLTLQREDFLARLTEITGGDRDKPVAFICRSGARSNAAAEQAIKAGHTHVYNVKAGMQGPGGWLEAGLPVRQS